MKMFTIGPVEMYPGVRDVQIEHFRTDIYSKLVIDNLKDIAEFLNTDYKNNIIYLASSGTGAMESSITNIIKKNDKNLVLVGGGFGERFCEILKHHNLHCDALRFDFPNELNIDKLNKYSDKSYTTLICNMHETTTGYKFDLELISEFCKKNNLLLVVDLIGSFLADTVDIKKYGIDVGIISSQKGLCCSPGIAMVYLSEKAMSRIETNHQNMYFNYSDYLKDISRGQTPYTPSVLTMYEIQKMIHLIKQVGIKKWLQDIEDKAKYTRNLANNYGFDVPKYSLSNMLTPLYFDGYADKIINKLKDEFKIYVNPCGGKLANKLLRISHLGNINKNDIIDLFEKIKYCEQGIK